ncbi:MAG TPA: PDZ domain-containing protein [Acidimicrobiia bacterium]
MPDDPTPENPTPGEQPTVEQPTVDQPTVDQPPTAPGEPPTVEAEAHRGADPIPEPPTASVTPAPAPAPSPRTAPVREPLSWSTGRVAAIVVLVLLLGAGAGFLVGRSTADSGPDSLAAAVKETANGDLPRGDLSPSDILGALGQGSGSGSGNSRDLGGLLGGLLGGSGKSGKNGKNGSRGDASGLLQQLLDRLQQQLGDSGGSGSGSGPESTPSAGTAFLGIAAEAAPSGQSGVRVASVADSSPAADAGLKTGDVVTAVDGTKVSTPVELVAAVRSHQPGDQITVTYTRDGQSTDVKVRLADSRSATMSPTAPPTTRAA